MPGATSFLINFDVKPGRMLVTYLKLLLITCCFIGIQLPALAQSDCYAMPIAKNLQPDTITLFSFVDRELPITQFPNSKPLSNYSFRTKEFKIYWVSFKNGNDSTFIRKTIYSDGNAKVLDTIDIQVFDKPYNGYIIEQKDRIHFLLFPSSSVKSDIFFVTIKRKKQLIDCIGYIKTYFSK